MYPQLRLALSRVRFAGYVVPYSGPWGSGTEQDRYQCYELRPDARLFPCTKYYLAHEMERGCKISGVKKIRIHDIRHSHASLLAEMGFSPLPIAERLWRERVQTTMETCSHLCPSKQTEIANRLDDVMS